MPIRTPLRAALAAALAAVTLGGTGCATVIGTSFAPHPYIGTVLDAAAIASNHHPALTAAAVVDLPLSLAADTLLLPVTGMIYLADPD